MATFKPIPQNVEGSILAFIRYTEDRPACWKCAHFCEDPIPLCRLFEDTLGHLAVVKDGACMHYRPRSGQKP